MQDNGMCHIIVRVKLLRMILASHLFRSDSTCPAQTSPKKPWMPYKSLLREGWPTNFIPIHLSLNDESLESSAHLLVVGYGR